MAEDGAIDGTEIVTRVLNPFENTAIDERANVGTLSIESERAIAQVKARMVMARANPRDKFRAMEKILETCRRLDFATTALYRYPRGSESVEGLTIRAAEVIANAWGNIDFDLFELSQADGESEWMARVVDLETNAGTSITFRFKHERHTRTATTKLTDPRDIYELGANYGARRLRARILAVVDQDVVAAAAKQVRATIAASVSGSGKKTLAEKTEELVKRLGEFGVKAKHIEAFIKCSIADITPDGYTDLATTYVSLKDGHGHASDYFDLPRGTTASEAAQTVDKKLSGETADQGALPTDA